MTNYITGYETVTSDPITFTGSIPLTSYCPAHGVFVSGEVPCWRCLQADLNAALHASSTAETGRLNAIRGRDRYKAALERIANAGKGEGESKYSTWSGQIAYEALNPSEGA